MKGFRFLSLMFGFFLLPAVLHARVLYSLDFTNSKNGDAVEWLEENDFSFQLDADDFDLKFQNGRLEIRNPEDNNGLLYKEVKIDNVKRVRIEWGVDAFAEGVDWEKGMTRDAIMVVVTFGTKKIDSGSFYIPNLPYFIGLFLGEKETEGKPYLGKHYRKGGRYFCAACGIQTGKTIVTDFELSDRFKQLFKKSSVPQVTSFAFESDSRDLKGETRAFIRKIEFLSE